MSRKRSCEGNRVLRSIIFCIALWLWGANAAFTATVPVFNTNDNLAGSLRQAIQDASTGDTIVFQIPTSSSGFNANTGVYTIGLTSGPLVIDKDLTIDGGGQKIRVTRAGASQSIFNLNAVTVSLLGLTITNGNNAAIQSFSGGTLVVTGCTFFGNTSPAGGGAVASSSLGTLRISNCTFTGNSAATFGSAIRNDGGTLFLDNSTITGNDGQAMAGNPGAAVYNGAGGTARVRNTIIAGNTSPAQSKDVNGIFISEGYNIIGTPIGSSGFGATGDQIGASTAQVGLGPLQDNGGPAPTMRPRPGSVAIDQGKRGLDGNNQPINTDQRGYPRPVDLPAIPNAIGGDGSDIGAVETGPLQAGPAFLVTNTDEHLSTGDGCTVDDCTLLEAITTANANVDTNTITFANGVGPVIVNQLQTSGYPITSPVTITGPGARQLAISGGADLQIFNITSQNVNISGLTLTDARALDSNGGAVSNAGGLTMTNCTIRNSAILTADGGGNGGGLSNASGATAVLNGCTFSGNSASQFGGGAVFNSGHLTATNCTFTGNTAPSGGGILSVADNGNSLVTLRNCTITNNTATSTGSSTAGGGGYYGEGAVGNSLHHFSNTILAGNINANNPDLRGFGTTEGNNLIGNLGQGGSGFSNGVNGDKVGVSPNFNSFGNNGGQTDTMSLLGTSPAINAGNNALAPPADQRGFGRSGISDMGAFEFNGVPPPINISGTVSYCSNPVPGPVPNVTLTLSGTTSGSTLSDGSGNYAFSSLAGGGNYTVTPTKAALAPGSAGITGVDAVATQRHFLNLGTPLSGCRLAAADVNGNSVVDGVDAVAIQRFFLGFASGIANVGKYQFSPASRAYSSVVTDQTSQNYDTLVFGDVASSFVERLDGGAEQDAAGDGSGVSEVAPTVAVVALPEVVADQAKGEFIAAVRASAIDANHKLVGFQGDFTFDERVVTFPTEPVQEAGLTSGNWNVSGNVLAGEGPIRTVRIMAYSNDFTPLSGSGTLFELRMTRVGWAAQGTQLIWAASPDQFIFVDADLTTQKPGNAAPGSVISISSVGGTADQSPLPVTKPR